jgi:hypothetical protein
MVQGISAGLAGLPPVPDLALPTPSPGTGSNGSMRCSNNMAATAGAWSSMLINCPYPGYERKVLPDLTSYLGHSDAQAIFSLLLDM